MDSDQISIEQLNISFGDLELHDSEPRVEEGSLSDLWQSFRTDRGEEDATKSRSRTDNGREKQLAVPKLSVRRNSGSSLSGTSKSDPPFPIYGRRSSMPRCGSPGLLERRTSESRKLLSIEQFVTFQEENGKRTNVSHGKAKDAPLTYSTQLTPGGEHTNPLVNPLDNAASSFGNLTKLTRRSKSGLANKSLPTLDETRTRRFSAPSSPSSFTRKGKYISAKPPQIQTDSALLPPTRKKTLSPLSSEGTLPRGSETSVVFPKKRQEKGHLVSADSNIHISPNDFKIPLSTKLAEQLENELSLIKGQNSIDKKKSLYSLTTEPFQDIPGMSNAERIQEETNLPRRSLRSSNQTVHHTNTDMFDPMFESYK